MEDIMVSVVFLTYNHEKFVKQALDSVLMQKANFGYEVIIGDDCSLDNTQQILKEYKKKNSEQINLILRDKNIGATRNLYNLISKAKGKYIAFIEGDDYWVDQYKLQKQVDFMEQNSCYIACVHKCVFVDRESNVIKDIPINRGFCNQEIYSINNYEQGYLPGQGTTLLMKNIFPNNEELFKSIYRINNIVGDATLILLLISHGDIYCLPDIMSHYRLDSNKESSSWNAIQERTNIRDEYYISQMALESFASKIVNRHISFDRRKKDIFLSAVFKMIREPSFNNIKVINTIILASRTPVRYVLFAFMILIKKVAYIMIYKDDRKVRY